MTSVRETIRCLKSEGTLNLQDNRRNIVSELSDKNISEHYFLRKTLQPNLVDLATASANEDVVGLALIDADLDDAINTGDINLYLHKNYEFHKELYRLTDVTILETTADESWMRYGLSLRVVCGRNGTLCLTDQHKETLTTMFLSDAEKA